MLGLIRRRAYWLAVSAGVAYFTVAVWPNWLGVLIGFSCLGVCIAMAVTEERAYRARQRIEAELAARLAAVWADHEARMREIRDGLDGAAR